MLVLNSQCNEIEALESFINAASDRSIVAVVGCGCSTATEEVAKIAHFLNISVVSCGFCMLALAKKACVLLKLAIRYIHYQTDFLCQHISGAQWQISVPQLLQNSSIRWTAAVSSGYHHVQLWVETSISLHWARPTISQCECMEYNCTSYNAIQMLSDLLNSIMTSLKLLSSNTLSTLNKKSGLIQMNCQITHSRKHPHHDLHLEWVIQLTRFYCYAWCSSSPQNTLRPHIFVPIASHRVETYLLCEVIKSTIITSVYSPYNIV